MELLKWVKEVTTGYAGVNIQTWSNSFNDGNAFSAVLHAFRPEGIDYDKAAKLKPLKALEQAFDIAAAEPIHYIGTDRAGRPTLLVIADRIAPHLTVEQRDRMLLYAIARIEPLASAAGEGGFALLLLMSAEFAWDMDLAWMQAARTRLRTEAPGYASKLQALYILRPSPFVRSLLTVAQTFVSKESLSIVKLVERDADLREHFGSSLRMPHGVSVQGVPNAARPEGGLPPSIGALAAGMLLGPELADIVPYATRRHRLVPPKFTMPHEVQPFVDPVIDHLVGGREPKHWVERFD